MPENDSSDFSFEDTLSVGQAVVVDPDPQDEDKSLRFSAFIRGWMKDEYILLDTRMETNRSTTLNRGQLCVLRFIAEGVAYAFTARVTDLGAGAYYDYARIAWPTEVKRVSVRRHERVEVNIPCTVEVGGGAPIQGELLDLSVGGCRVVLPNSIGKGEKALLSFNLPDGGALSQLSGIVRNVVASKSGHSVGFEFQDLSEDSNREIGFYVAAVLNRHRTPAQQRPWVLVVDPKPERVGPLKEALEQQGVTVITEDNAATGITRLAVSTPSVLLLGYDQSPCTGLEVCRVIRTAARFASLPVFVYGEDASKEKDLLAQAEKAGATGAFPSISITEPIARAIKNILHAQ